MQVYSVSPLVRSRQLVADGTALVLIVLSVTLGVLVQRAVAALAEFGRRVEAAGDGLRGSMSDAASTLSRVPLLGDAAAAPFRSASKVGGSLAASGQDQQDVVATAAVVAGLLVALLPIAAILWVWLRRRIAFARRATSTARLATSPAGIELLALRALARGRSDELLPLAPDPVAGWRRGDEEVIRALSEVELRSAGVLR